MASVSALLTMSEAVLSLPECTASAGYVPVIVCGLVATFDGVTVVVHVEAAGLPVLGVNTQVPPKPSVGSEELRATVPSGLNDGV